MTWWIWGLVFWATPGQLPLDIIGNEVLAESVYRREARIPPGAEPTKALAADVESRIRSFLKASGYDLAEVAVRVRGDGLEVAVDEGKLDKIIFPGQDAVRAVGMNFFLDLPKNIFNRRILEQQIPVLERQFSVKVIRYDIRRRPPEKNRALSFSNLTGIDRLVVFPERSRHELFIFAEQGELRPGFHLQAKAQGPDGLTTSFVFRLESVFAPDDRLELFPEVGLRIQDAIEDGEGRRFLSRAGVSARWLSPPLSRFRLRPYIWPRGYFLSRQRRDLDVSRYDFLVAEPTVGVSIPFARWIEMSVGTGVQYRNLTGIRVADMAPSRVDPVNEARAVVDLGFSGYLGPDHLRLDRRHRFQASARLITAFDGTSILRSKIGYVKTFLLGRDDLRFRFDVESLFGTIVFTDEIRVGDHLRGLFGDSFYTERIASVRFDYFVPVFKEILRLGIYHDGTIFEGVDRDTLRTFTRVANSFGPGAQTLLFDAFKVSVYGSVGFMSADGPTDVGAVLEISQIF
ncbi:MAG: hypothetical protein ACFB9M_04955 [Myxococcota bacterium]